MAAKNRMLLAQGLLVNDILIHNRALSDEEVKAFYEFEKANRT